MESLSSQALGRLGVEAGDKSQDEPRRAQEKGGATPAKYGAPQAAETIDALFAPLPPVETRGRVWLFVNKELKPVNLRLGVTDGTVAGVGRLPGPLTTESNGDAIERTNPITADGQDLTRSNAS